MKSRLIIITVLALSLFAISPLAAQNPERGGGQRGGPPRPTPRWPDGRLNLGAPPDEKGIWAPAGIVQLAVNPNAVNRAGATTHLPNNIKIEDVPFQPWARALHEAREAAYESDEPHTRCKISGGPRQFITPYGVESGVETRSEGDYSPVYFKTPPAKDKGSFTVTITDTLDVGGAAQFFYDAFCNCTVGGRTFDGKRSAEA